jgi:hypothetical protein
MTLIATFPQAESVDSGHPELEQVLADLSVRNELLLAQKHGIEQRRPSEAECELRVLMLQTKSTRDAANKLKSGKDTSENAVLRDEISKTEKSIK